MASSSFICNELEFILQYLLVNWSVFGVNDIRSNSCGCGSQSTCVMSQLSISGKWFCRRCYSDRFVNRSKFIIFIVEHSCISEQHKELLYTAFYFYATSRKSILLYLPFGSLIDPSIDCNWNSSIIVHHLTLSLQIIWLQSFIYFK